MFGGGLRPDEPTVDLKMLHAKIGQLALENDFSEGALIKRRHTERKAMIDRTHPLPITRQAQIVGISRGSVDYESEPISDADLKLMRCIDELHLELPFAGARMLRDLLRTEVLRCWAQAHDHADASHGHHGAVPQTEQEQESSRQHDLPVPAAHPGAHEFAQCVEDFSELVARVAAEGVVVHGQRLGLVFELGQPLNQVAVPGRQVAHAHQGAHDFDVDREGA